MALRRKLLAAGITLAALVALCASSYLTWTIWQSQDVAGCTAESLFDCDSVLSSRWSKWLGLPVSLLGALTYLAILSLSWPAAARRDGLPTLALFALGGMAAGAAVWFIGLQVIEIKSICFYCMAVHACGLLVGGLTLLLFLDRSGSNDMSQMRSLLGVAVDSLEEDLSEPVEVVSGARLLTALSISAVGLVVLMGGQLLVEPPEENPLVELELDDAVADESSESLLAQDLELAESTPLDPVSTETVSSTESQVEDSGDEEVDYVLDSDGVFEELGDSSSGTMTVGSIIGSTSGSKPDLLKFQALPEAIAPDSLPILGSTKAKHVVVELIDYTCDHCRKLHPHLDAAVERYDGQFAVLVYHSPLSKKCNPYVRRDYPGKKDACGYAQLAIGVWRYAPEKFPEYHNWLMEGDRPPNISKATRQAWRLVGSEISRDKKMKAEISKLLSKQCAVMKRLKSGLPIVLLQNSSLSGVPKKSEELFRFLESKLDLTPPQ